MNALILLLAAIGTGVYALYTHHQDTVTRFMELEQDVDEA